jgi:hypothetical protein
MLFFFPLLLLPFRPQPQSHSHLTDESLSSFLSSIPSCATSRIRSIDLTDNSITTIPWSLGSTDRFPSLKHVWLDENPCCVGDLAELHGEASPSPQAGAQVLSFLQEGEKGLETISSIKLLLVGHGDAGKSTVGRSLQLQLEKKHNAHFAQLSPILPDHRTTSVMMDIQLEVAIDHALVASAPPPSFPTHIRFRVLDFPGQPHYFAVNHYFLKELNESLVILTIRLYPRHFEGIGKHNSGTPKPNVSPTDVKSSIG